jgi:serine/threonine protein kinase
MAMTPLAACPDVPLWRQLLRGQLVGADAETLRRHLASCTACVATWQKLQAEDARDPPSLSRAPTAIDELLAQQRQRWQRGETIPVETYLRERPELVEDASAVLDLIYHELLLRERRGEKPTLEEYERRFPAHAEKLRLQIALDSALLADTRLDLGDERAGAHRAYPFLAPAEEPDEIGRLGSYRVLSVLGQGGMGLVFHAEDLHLKRPVALKVMQPRLAADKEAWQRFLREAQAAAAVRDDHIVTIYHIGLERVPFLAMALLQGETLEQRQQRGPLTVAEVLRIGRDVAEGLAAAHKRGLIHRDIKPANLWLEADSGRVKILDFGLARVEAAADATHLTMQGEILGTPGYIAPEQVRGLPPEARSDLFSLGCVLYQMSTGVLPFDGATPVAKLEALATRPPRPPLELNAALPPALAGLILRLLAKPLAQRPNSAAAVAQELAALEGALSTTPSLASARGLRRVARVLALLGLLGLGTVLVWSVVDRLRTTDNPETSFSILPPKGDEPRTERPREPVTVQRSPLDDCDPAAIPATERFPWQPQQLVAVLGEHRQRHWDGVLGLAFAPDGRLLASGGADGLRLWDAASGQEARVLPAGCPSFASDRSRLLSWWGREMRLIDPATGQAREDFSTPGHVLKVEQTTDGTNCAVVLRPGAIQVVEIPSLKVRAALPAPLEQKQRPLRAALAPDGKSLAVGYAGGEVRLWDLATCRERAVIPGKALVPALAFTPEGALLATCADKEVTTSQVRLWRTATGQEIATLPVAPAPITELVFASDCQTLILGDARGTVRFWDVPSRHCGAEFQALVGAIDCLALAPRGQMLACGNHRGVVRLWRLGSSGPPHEIQPLRGHTGRVVNLVFAPDNRTLASAATDGAVRLWELPTCRERAVLVDGAGSTSCSALRFSPDGRTLSTGGEGQGLRRWEAAAGKEETRARWALPHALALDPTGRTVANHDEGGSQSLTVHDTATRQPRFTIPSCWCPVYSPDGRTLAALRKQGDAAQVVLWDVATGRESAALTKLPDRTWCLAFSPDGTALAAAGDEVRLWDLETPEPRLTLAAGQRLLWQALAFTPDGRSLAAASGLGRVSVWDLTDGRRLHAWDFPGAVAQLVFAPDGRHLATANPNGTVYLLRLAPAAPRGR